MGIFLQNLDRMFDTNVQPSNHTWLKPWSVTDMQFDTYDDSIYFSLLHANTLLCSIFSSLAIYFILFKSPPTIGNYKWYLLNIAVMSFVYDFYMTCFWLPMPLFPSMVMCSRGWLQGAGWFIGGMLGYILFPILCGACAMTIVFAFAYRWAILTGREHKINSWWGILLMAFIQIFNELPTTIIYVIACNDRPFVLEALYKHYPNIRPFMDRYPCSAAAFESSSWSFPFIVSQTLQFFGGVPASILFLSLSYKALDAQKDSMSAKTAQMHRQMLKALILQLIVPFCTLFVPFTLLAYFVMMEAEFPALYKSLFVLGSLHSVTNTLMMILHIGPYRMECHKLLHRIFGKCVKMNRVSTLVNTTDAAGAVTEKKKNEARNNSQVMTRH